MKRFNTTFKTFLTITGLVPLSLIGIIAMGIVASQPTTTEAAQIQKISEPKGYPTLYKTIEVDGQTIFYREAGPKDAPTILLLHGFPTSSHMFRNLIPQLSDRFHLVAPDYPGYGNSSMPPVDKFDYSFDNLAKVMEHFIQKVGLKKYSLYLMDYGAPVGFRGFRQAIRNESRPSLSRMATPTWKASTIISGNRSRNTGKIGKPLTRDLITHSGRTSRPRTNSQTCRMRTRSASS
jgi:hypothetical protein